MIITRDECGRPYCYDVVAPIISELLEVEIDRHSVSKEAQNQITELLKLKEADTEDALRGIRNAVVEIFSNLMGVMYDVAGNRDAMLKVGRSASGITAVIDSELFDRGYRV